MRILLVDDHVLFREGLASLLNNQGGITVVGEAGSVHKAIARAVELKPDLIIMDISLPDGNGVDAVKAILAENPKIKIIMLTIHETDDLLFAALRAGAKGYLLKNTPLSKLIASLKAMERGEAAISRTMTNRVLDEFIRLGKLDNSDLSGAEALSSRELEVLKLLSTGASNREIADQLHIAENTVKIHVHKILEKLNLRNRREAARFAQRQGLVDSSLDSNLSDIY